MALAAIALLLLTQQDFKEELTIKGFHLFARCWRTPTGETPDMIWTIGSKDPAPTGEKWRIKGEAITFDNLPIIPGNLFTKELTASDTERVAGLMFEQPGGEN